MTLLAPTITGSGVARWGPAGLAGAASVAFVLVHLAVAGRVGLSVDEAHYGLYGLLLDWSYFDHPPMVGWLMAPVVALTREEWALRLWPAVLSLVAAWQVFRLTRTLFPETSEWTAAVAVLLLQSGLIFQVLSIGLVPEMPLLVFGLAAGLTLYRAVETGGVFRWILTGALFGLAGLSKYTAVLLVATALLYIGWQRQWRLLRQPGPWLAALVAALVISPVLFWNATHDWISFAYQLGHGAPDREWSLQRFLTAQAGQLLGYGPLIYIAGIAALAGSPAESRHRGVRFSLALGGPVLLLFAWSGGYEETLPHWTLFGWTALAPLTARWLVSRWPQRRVRLLAGAGAVYSAALTLVIHTALFTPWLPFSHYNHPLGDLFGWRQAAERAAELFRADTMAAIYVTNWTQASRIAWYAWPRPVQVLDSRRDQFDLWFGNPEPGQSGLLLVRDEGESTVHKAERRFGRCEPLDELTYRIDGRPAHRFRLLHCRDFRG